MEVARSVKVLTDLDGGPEFGGKLGETLHIIVDNRLLDPGKPEIVDDVASLKRFTQMKTLIEIDHQGHVFPDRFAHSFDGCDIISAPLAAQSQVQPAKPPSFRSSTASAATASGSFNQRPLLL